MSIVRAPKLAMRTRSDCLPGWCSALGSVIVDMYPSMTDAA